MRNPILINLNDSGLQRPVVQLEWDSLEHNQDQKRTFHSNYQQRSQKSAATGSHSCRHLLRHSCGMSSFPTLQVFHKTKPIKHGAFLKISQEAKDHQGQTPMAVTGTWSEPMTWCFFNCTQGKCKKLLTYQRSSHVKSSQFRI